MAFNPESLQGLQNVNNEVYFNENVTFFKKVFFSSFGQGSGTSGFVFDNDVTFNNKSIFNDEATFNNGATFNSEVTFDDDATFNNDVTINGELDVDFLLVRTRLDVGVGGTALNIDTRTEKIGIFTATPQQKFQFNSEEENTFVITGLGTVGIGTTNPGIGVTSLNEATQGKLGLEVDTVSIKKNIYDSAGWHGYNGSFLNRDAGGIRWVDFTPGYSQGIYVQDEGVYIPTVGAAQSFTVLNFTQINSLGVGTDNIIPIPHPSSPGLIANIQSKDLWGYNASGNIYRMTNVGINNNTPVYTLDVNGTLNVNSSTTLNNTLDVDGATTLNSTLDVDGGTTLNNTLDVDGGTTLNSTLDVDGGTTLNSTLDVDGTSIFRDSVELESSLIDINGEIGPVGRDFRLSSVGTGVSWRPPGVETQNTIWVTKDGNDANSGLLEGDAKATVGAAATIAQPGDTIKIRPGRYVENNPIGLQNDVTVTGEDLRLVTIEPQNTSLDVFWVRRGCLIENLNFAGATIGVNHPGCGAVAFPVTGSTANSGYPDGGPATETTRWRSPYIRNCTNFMTGSIGMRIDGNDATASIPGADLKSMVCDSFTQYNQNGIGVSITNDAYAQLVSIFTINCDKAIYVDTGGQCDLTNSNSSFGNYGLYAVGLGATQYTGLVSADIIPDGETNDTVSAKNVQNGSGQYKRPFDGQAAYFKINLSNYADAVGSGRINAPLRRVARINVTNGGVSGEYTATAPPTVTISDADGTVVPKGPQGIVAEALANIGTDGTITSIDIIESGRNYLPTQNLIATISGSASASVVTEPIYYTVSEATSNVSGNTTITFNEFIPYQLYVDDPFTLQRISRILTSSHSFEYVGTGTDINTALPFQGALPIKENEVVALDGAQIPFTSTDQKGNFDIGEGIQVDQTTSTIRGRDFSKAIQAEVTPLILALR